VPGRLWQRFRAWPTIAQVGAAVAVLLLVCGVLTVATHKGGGRPQTVLGTPECEQLGLDFRGYGCLNQRIRDLGDTAYDEVMTEIQGGPRGETLSLLVARCQ